MTADTTQPAGAQARLQEAVDRQAKAQAGVGSESGWFSHADIRAMMAERDAARQSLWDVYAALGCDTDGDPTPAALVGDLGALVLDAAKEAAKDYREA